MRAVGVNEQAAGLTWMWAGARPAPAAGAGCLRWLVSTTQASASSPCLRARAPSLAADVRPRRALASISTCPDCRRQAALLYKCTFRSSTVPTDCTITVMQQEIKWLFAGSIPALFLGQTLHFWVNYIIITVFPYYYHLYYLLNHDYYIHYYPVIATLLPIIRVIIYYSLLHLLLPYYYSLLHILLHHYYILLPGMWFSRPFSGLPH